MYLRRGDTGSGNTTAGCIEMVKRGLDLRSGLDGKESEEDEGVEANAKVSLD